VGTRATVWLGQTSGSIVGVMTAERKQDAVRALHARGRDAWPNIELELARFSARAVSRLGDGPFEDVRADDLYLAIACAVRINAALAALDKQYLSGLVAALVRRGHDSANAADAVQALRVRFLVGEAGRMPRIADYDGRGSLATWLRVAAVRIASNAHRKHHREVVVDDVQILAAAHSPEIDLLQHRFSGEFAAAFRSAFEALTPRERNLLRYQMIDQLGIDRIAALHGVHRATAARWVAHARDALLEGVRRILQHRLHIDRPELDSLLHLLHSKLELSLRLFLTPTP
jgi:RNA polymerase sigma-70 factor, ECF subfamily